MIDQFPWDTFELKYQIHTSQSNHHIFTKIKLSNHIQEYVISQIYVFD